MEEGKENFFINQYTALNPKMIPIMYLPYFYTNSQQLGLGEDRIRFHVGFLEEKGKEAKENFAPEGYDLISMSIFF